MYFGGKKTYVRVTCLDSRLVAFLFLCICCWIYICAICLCICICICICAFVLFVFAFVFKPFVFAFVFEPFVCAFVFVSTFQENQSAEKKLTSKSHVWTCATLINAWDWKEKRCLSFCLFVALYVSFRKSLRISVCPLSVCFIFCFVCLSKAGWTDKC